MKKTTGHGYRICWVLSLLVWVHIFSCSSEKVTNLVVAEVDYSLEERVRKIKAFQHWHQELSTELGHLG